MIGITFADDKFLSVAEEQRINFNKFGIEHHTIKINSANYDMSLWLALIDETILAVRKYGKILKVDSEVRIEKELPKCWLKESNVFFFIEPMITDPYYIALNTGQMILDESAMQFLHYQKVLTQSLVPPGFTGKLGIDDEDMTAPAIKLSNVQYLKEVIDYKRSDDSKAKATRGYWKNDNTVLTHPFFHNWNTAYHNIGPREFFRNHFNPSASTEQVDMILKGLEKKIESTKFWNSLGFESGVNGDWYINPKESSYWHTAFDTPKILNTVTN